MKIMSPSAGANLVIGQDATWPALTFQTDGVGAHIWKWSIAWRTYTKTGNLTTPGNLWNALSVLANFGGTLTVTAIAGKETASFAGKITGTNPTAQQVTTYLQTKPNSTGFDSILQHETKARHFNAQGEPVRSFDNGYGMAQLTNPAPTYEQVWNWKLNIDAGLLLFGQKRAAAVKYLSQQGRTYTDVQLEYETVSRWNGGSYHTWDEKAKAWVRNPDILCDTKTGNIGWDMTDAANKGKTEQDLRARDSTSYSSPPASGDHWDYFGVCYADRVLG